MLIQENFGLLPFLTVQVAGWKTPKSERTLPVKN